ncbi:hypothetical protein E3E36_04670 [Thermococcus sp. M36]|uniref:DUF257 family protein n=1 Tax=Thermococcus sp. M36 TaxID=1638261 RepID=UPI00143C646E|nr:DUF257 family protein [Thermococcus sp. M36]NJE05446.1 hypothetical protein [Thermococcus sp. M36]
MHELIESLVFDYADMIRPGELVLVEYTSREPVYLLFQIITEYARSRNVPLIVVDILDGLHVMKSQLRFAGIDTSPIDEIPVLKVGGKVDTGRVFSKVEETAEIAVFKRQFMNALKRIREEFGDIPFIRIVVGTSELLQLLERDPPKMEEFFAGLIRPLVGNPYTRGVVFINRKRVCSRGLKEAEEISTRVLETRAECGKLTIRVVKSIYFEEYKAEVQLDPCTLRERLASGGE